MKHILTLSLVCGFLIVGCGKQDKEESGSSSQKSADAAKNSGNCSSEFLAGYNSLNHQRRMLKITLSGGTTNPETLDRELKDSQKICKKFFLEHADVSCKAKEVGYAGEEKQVQSNDHKEFCELIERHLSTPETLEH